MTPTEKDRAVLSLLKWRVVLRHATSAQARIDAIRAIDLIERKLMGTTAPRGGGGKSNEQTNRAEGLTSRESNDQA